MQSRQMCCLLYLDKILWVVHWNGGCNRERNCRILPLHFVLRLRGGVFVGHYIIQIYGAKKCSGQSCYSRYSSYVLMHSFCQLSMKTTERAALAWQCLNCLNILSPGPGRGLLLFSTTHARSTFEVICLSSVLCSSMNMKLILVHGHSKQSSSSSFETEYAQTNEQWIPYPIKFGVSMFFFLHHAVHAHSCNIISALVQLHRATTTNWHVF